MFRRAVGVLLLLMLLLFRGGLIGHAHEATESTAPLRRHVHVGRLWSNTSPEKVVAEQHHSHRHRHHHATGHHHHHKSEVPADPMHDGEDEAIVEIDIDDAVVSAPIVDFEHYTGCWSALPQFACDAAGLAAIRLCHSPPDFAFGTCLLHLLNLVLII